jgi:hypothetical protein
MTFRDVSEHERPCHKRNPYQSDEGGIIPVCKLRIRAETMADKGIFDDATPTMREVRRFASLRGGCEGDAAISGC